MNSKIFPPPPAPYDAAEHLERIRKQQEAQLDYYPWAPRVLAALVAAVMWGLIVTYVLCVFIAGQNTIGDYTSSFALGFGIPLVFSVPFLWK